MVRSPSWCGGHGGGPGWDVGAAPRWVLVVQGGLCRGCRAMGPALPSLSAPVLHEERRAGAGRCWFLAACPSISSLSRCLLHRQFRQMIFPFVFCFVLFFSLWFSLYSAARRGFREPSSLPKDFRQVERLWREMEKMFQGGNGMGRPPEQQPQPEGELCARILVSACPPQGSAWGWSASAPSSSSLGCSCTSTRCSWLLGT